MSDKASGSAFSLMKTPAVVCGTYTWQRPVSMPLSRTTCCTRSVMLIASARLPDRTARTSVFTALAIIDIVTTDPSISQAGDRDPIMADVRDLPIGNGALLVTFDLNYQIRDIYYPRVGQENHTSGEPCRFGIWVDGRFTWLDDPAWSRNLVYMADTLVTNVTLRHPDLLVSLTFNDTVDLGRDLLLRRVRVLNEGPDREVRLFFHFDWHIYGTEVGDTVMYYPAVKGLVAYKGQRCFAACGQVGERTRSYWTAWVNKEERGFADLSPQIADLYRRCLLVVRTQIDSGGAVLAANDTDIIKFARDTYSYMWPRDAALAVYAMDQAGYV